MSTDSPLRSDWVALALATCAHCQGTGLRPEGTCGCVYRRIFRAVMNKFRDCAQGSHLARPFSLLAASGPKGRRVSGRKHEEFSADVYLTAKRTLTDHTEWAVFRFHYLMGADWKLCGHQLGMDKGTFFHAAYRVEQRLGKVWATLKPYALYPLDEYFSACTRRVDVRPFLIRPARLGRPLRPPLAPRPPAPAAEIAAPVAMPPAPVVCALPAPPDPEPAPVAPFNSADEVEVARYARKRFHAGQSLAQITYALVRFRVLTPNGGEFRPFDVKRLLLRYPREPGQRFKRAA